MACWGPAVERAGGRAPVVDGFMTSMSATVVDAQGKEVPVARVMLHHVLFSNEGASPSDRKDGSCPDIPRERFFGRGEEGRRLGSASRR